MDIPCHILIYLSLATLYIILSQGLNRIRAPFYRVQEFPWSSRPIWKHSGTFATWLKRSLKPDLTLYMVIQIA